MRNLPTNIQKKNTKITVKLGISKNFPRDTEIL